MKIISILNTFGHDRRGNFAILTALLAVPVIASVGVAVDVSRALLLKEQFFGAADAAAVGAVAEKSPAAAQAMLMSGDGTIAIGQDDAKAIFTGQLGNDASDIALNVNAAVNKQSNVLTSAISFTATVPTTFMQILGWNSLQISGKASATYQTAAFMDFYILLDNTPSMGVGATTKDVAMMVSHTSDKCAFACHETGDNKGNDYYTLAQNLKVTTRIDVVRQATLSLVSTAISRRVSDSQFRMAVYTFGDSAETVGLKNVAPLTASLDNVTAQVGTKKSNGQYPVDLMTIPFQGYGSDSQTGFDATLTSLAAQIPASGNGSTNAQSQKILFFVSDGVGDFSKPKTCTKPTDGDRCQEPIDTKFCTPIKAQGIKIAVLYTTYLPLPTNPWYNQWIAPFQSQIATNMANCASPGLYFEVSPTQGISDAMNALFLKVISTPRISS
jgi:Flp pilus assembly protein TadG